MRSQNRVRLGQNKISYLFLNGSDLQDREKEVLKDACKRLDFIPKKLLDRSHWWTSKEIGAFRYEGEFEGKKAVLKVQGVKPATSEIYMIQSFSERNKSKILRPPLLYAYLPWDNEKRYEALVLEFVDGIKVVNTPTNKNELEEFFNLRKEYKENCVDNHWIEKPKRTLSQEVKINFAKWRKASYQLYPTHPFRKSEDRKLIDKAVDLLAKNYETVKPEFQHGHFGISDLLKAENGQVAILSNLYWSWKPPFYDAVFGYHWFMYGLASIKNVNIEFVEQQRSLWLTKINSLAKTKEDKKLLNLALLERAAAGLNLDALSIDPKIPIAEYLVQLTRTEIKKLIKGFKTSV